MKNVANLTKIKTIAKQYSQNPCCCCCWSIMSFESTIISVELFFKFVFLQIDQTPSKFIIKHSLFHLLIQFKPRPPLTYGLPLIRIRPWTHTSPHLPRGVRPHVYGWRSVTRVTVSGQITPINLQMGTEDGFTLARPFNKTTERVNGRRPDGDGYRDTISASEDTLRPGPPMKDDRFWHGTGRAGRSFSWILERSKKGQVLN